MTGEGVPEPASQMRWVPARRPWRPPTGRSNPGPAGANQGGTAGTRFPSLGSPAQGREVLFFGAAGSWPRLWRYLRGGETLNPVMWMAGLALLFVLFDEWQRLRRRVRALEERLERLERGERGESSWPAN